MHPLLMPWVLLRASLLFFGYCQIFLRQSCNDHDHSCSHTKKNKGGSSGDEHKGKEATELDPGKQCVLLYLGVSIAVEFHYSCYSYRYST